MSKKSRRIQRREFLFGGLSSAAVLSLISRTDAAAWSSFAGGEMKMGLVTYQWGRDWDLETLITNCEKAGFQGVELRTEHAHGVEPTLSPAQRIEVKNRFADSPIECVGYGSNQEYHAPDPAVVKANIEGTFDLIRLCHDIGATGVKVKPNNLPDDVPAEKTIAQIGDALNQVGKYAADYGQVIRVEVHGRKTAELPVMKAIFDHVDQQNVKVCWNCNGQDLLDPGLKYNFDLVKDRFGDTVHVRELDSTDYPYPEFFELLKGIGYSGWILLEARTEPADRVAAMKDQLRLFEKYTS
ncbi:MAG: sugar phosphate isomerase/epimerase [Acidobacteriota bacterium]|nr:MAG: sugar phosphate isomerase/epimerase [Acidobacteriota bacterium]